MRKLNEPVYVANAFPFTTPEPILDWRGHRVHAVDTPTAGDKGTLGTEAISAYPDREHQFVSSAYGAYYNRVFAIPARLILIDPPEGYENAFFLWNANFAPVTLAAIDADADTGIVPSFTVGLTLADLELYPANVIVTPAAPLSQETIYNLDFGVGGVTRFEVSLLRTNLLIVPPERPIMETLRWKTDVMTARDGTEQRVSLMQYPRLELDFKIIFQDQDEQDRIFRQFYAKAAQAFSVPLWQKPYKLLSDALAGFSQLEIDTSLYDIAADDTLYLMKNNGLMETVRVQAIELDGITVTLYSTLQNTFTTDDKVYRGTTVMVPEKPSRKLGSYGHVEANMLLKGTEFRELFYGPATTQATTESTVLPDRVVSDVVYTMNDLPILHARPVLKDDTLADEDFDWKFEIIDYEVGAFERVTGQSNAQVTRPRSFLIKNRTQEYYYNYILNHAHGQRRALWVPTWGNELGISGTFELQTVAGDTLTITGEEFVAEFSKTQSHRGVWMKYGDGWIARRIIDVFADGAGDTVVKLETEVPVDFPPVGPYDDIGFLVLSRLGSDEVQFERYPAYSFLTATFASTPTATGA